LLISKVV